MSGTSHVFDTGRNDFLQVDCFLILIVLYVLILVLVLLLILLEIISENQFCILAGSGYGSGSVNFQPFSGSKMNFR
jgi:hypothetical protein